MDIKELFKSDIIKLGAAAILGGGTGYVGSDAESAVLERRIIALEEEKEILFTKLDEMDTKLVSAVVDLGEKMHQQKIDLIDRINENK